MAHPAWKLARRKRVEQCRAWGDYTWRQLTKELLTGNSSVVALMGVDHRHRPTKVRYRL